MKFKIFLLILFNTFLYSEELHYKKYIEILLSKNLEIKIQQKNQEKVEQFIKKKESIFYEPFKLEMSYSSGKVDIPYNVLKNEYPAQQILKQYTIGLSKIIDVLNQQKTEKTIFVVQKEMENEYLNLIKMQNILEFRNAYFHLIFLNIIHEHLEEHIVRFNLLKKQFLGNYFDKKLGYYTIPALELGINTLSTELQENNTLMNEKITLIKNLLFLSEDTSLDFDSIEQIEDLLPSDLTIDNFNYENSPLLKIELLKLKLIEENIELYKKLPFSNIEMFFNYSEKNQGKYSSFSFSTQNPQKENLWTFGIKIPLPYGSEKTYDVSIQQYEYQLQQLRIEKIRGELKNQIQMVFKDYLNHFNQYKSNRKLLKKHEPYLKMLEESLIKRRITYFEFWGEHEKFHNLLNMTSHSFQKAVESLSLLELYLGQKIIKD
jgi:hypothetical protein